MKFQAGRFQLGSRPTRVVGWLIGINAAIFLLYSFAGGAVRAAIVEWLVLTPRSLLAGHLWKLVTTAFVPNDGLTFILDLFVLWMFIPVLESNWGSRRFLIFAASMTILANLVSSGVGLALGWEVPIGGLTSFIYAGIVGFGVAFADKPVQFFGVVPMRGRTLAIGFAVIIAVSILLNRAWVQGAGYAAVMAAALGWVTGRIDPQLLLLRWRRARLKRRYAVLKGGVPESPRNDKWLN